MDVWSRLRADLLALEQREPDVLMTYPDPRSERADGPLGVVLAAFAEDVAADLHAKYGTGVRLTLGALPYPVTDSAIADPLPLPVVADLAFSLAGPLTVRSGHSAQHDVLVANSASETARLYTSGALVSVVVDPGSGRTVGGSTQPWPAKLVQFPIAAGAAAAIPIFVGTESFDPALGYRVPPGEWSLVALLDVGFGDQDVRRAKTASPPMPFTVHN